MHAVTNFKGRMERVWNIKVYRMPASPAWLIDLGVIIMFRIDIEGTPGPYTHIRRLYRISHITVMVYIPKCI